MWRTPLGDRKLVTAEVSLWCTAAGLWMDLVLQTDMDLLEQVLHPLLQDLSKEQLLAALQSIDSLLQNDAAAPEAAAYQEAMLADVYHHLQAFFETVPTKETKEELAWVEQVLEERLRIRKRSEWEVVIECLADRILWDRDFDLLELQDAPPQERKRLGQAMGIADGYFVNVVPETTKTLEMLRVELDASLNAGLCAAVVQQRKDGILTKPKRRKPK